MVLYENSNLESDTPTTTYDSGDNTKIVTTHPTHTYADPQWSWKDTDGTYTASATLTCAICNATKTMSAHVTSETIEPACTEAGSTVYTATITLTPDTDTTTSLDDAGTYTIVSGANTYQGMTKTDDRGYVYTDTKTVTIAATEHSRIEVADDPSKEATFYYCTVCKKYFDAAENEISDTAEMFYIIADGTQAKHQLQTDDVATLHCTGNLQYFQYLTVDGTKLNEGSYSVGKASNLVTFTNDYLEGLDVGSYDATFYYQFGDVTVFATGTLSITSATSDATTTDATFSDDETSTDTDTSSDDEAASRK